MNADGTITGTPTQPGKYPFLVMVTDADSTTALKPLSITIPADGGYCWSHRMGDTGDDYGRDVSTDANGNIYVVGYFEGNVDFGEDWSVSDPKNSAGTYDAFVTKIDSEGNYCWTRVLGDTTEDEAYAVCTDPSGNIYVAGYFTGTVNFEADWGGTDSKSTPGGGDEDGFITRINADGSYGWTHILGGISGSGDTVKSICADTSGNVYAVGHTYSPSVNFAADWSGTDTKTIQGTCDGFVTKINADGTYGWTYRIGGAAGDFTNAVCTDSGGNVYTTGHFYSATVNFAEDWGGSDSKNCAGSYDIFVTKVNANGTYGWTHRMGDTGGDGGYAICSDPSGNVYVSGHFGSSSVNFADDWGGSDSKSCAGGTDIFVTKINADGSYGWTHRMGGPSTDRGDTICSDSGGNVYVAGDFASASVDFATDWGSSDSKSSAGSYDVFITKIYPDGSYGWTHSIGDTGGDEVYGISEDGGGNLYIAGYFDSANLNFAADWSGTDTKSTAGGKDIFVTKISNLPWSRGKDMPTARCRTGSSVVNGKIYVFGGYYYDGGDTRIDIVEEYDPSTNTWTPKTSMPTARELLVTSAVNGMIYAIGGDTPGYLTTVEQYEPATDTWTPKTGMSTARGDFTSSVVGGKIYVFGGYNGGLLSSVEEYDPVADTWTYKTSMPTARYGPTSSVVNGKIYVIGGTTNGTDKLDCVEVYDPVKDAWSTCSSMPTGRKLLTSSVVNGKIYVIGGRSDASDYTSIVEVYDPATDTWVTATDMLIDKVSMTSSTVNGKIYVIGGWDSGINELKNVEIYDPVVSFDLWLESSPADAPSARQQHAMAYDSTRGVTVLFGGVNGTNEMNDTWEYDGRNWVNLSPEGTEGVDYPSPRYSFKMVYDSARNVVVLFGGALDATSYVYSDETWEWGGATWTKMSPTISPSARGQTAMAYDSQRQKVVLFGGQTGAASFLQETWEYDGTTWEQNTPVSQPPSMQYPAMTYDSSRAVVVLFGGHDGSRSDDTWEWNGANWTQRSPASKPAGRYCHSMAFDSGRGQTVVFGGNLDGNVQDNDVWAWDGMNWLEKAPWNSPSARQSHRIVYDSARGVMVLFGGWDGNSVGDTWLYWP